MKELDFINTYLGGHQITIAGLKKLLPKDTSEIHVVEIGCGGGDNLRAIKNWCEKKRINVQLTGVDINPECIQFAQSRKENNSIDFICSDYKKATFKSKPHIIFSSLFCHHFTDDELVYTLEWMENNCSKGFFINDLHRHFLAYHSIKWLTQLFSKSYMVKNDAPLSVQRGFSKTEWHALLKKAGLHYPSIQWKWAFRWLVIRSKDHGIA
jgi:2-polyprenyl-3-methyl-5-hydroxy-6-metoxy-1,4-benzoquinol methylase